MEKRVRFAPSPTGAIHIGNIRTALFNYLFSRSEGAKLILRIEDTDLTRSSKDFEKLIFKELKWLGIEWDEGPDKPGQYGPYRQSERLPIYKKYAEQLINDGKAYRCYCTPEELEEDRKQSVAKGDIPKYSGRCRYLTKEQEEEFIRQGRKPSIRFIIPDDETIVFDDMIKGRIEIKSDTLGGDMIIVKSDGMPTYNFAVVIDDTLMKISHVIRGEDHIYNTPKQLLIYKALGFVPPTFAHAPLILGPDRTKLSKRHGNTYIGQYRELGYLPEAMFNFLSLLSWSPEDNVELMSKEEIIKKFDFNRIHSANPVFDVEKLNWMNEHYIQKSSIERIVDLAIPHLKEAGYIDTVDDNLYKWLKDVVLLFKDGLHYVAEIKDNAKMFFVDEIDYDNQLKGEILKGDAKNVLLSFQKELEGADDISEDAIKTLLKTLQKKIGIKGKAFFMPIRFAITGQDHGPELIKVIPLLGKQKILNRLNKAMNLIS
ncbi:glutamate--tRNA ligase [Thermoanaerobacterium sp. RBIITD]|uniref:glutamate--tRNA ligase n=1 Tax=Thermoanaerobacterium sp. RBIITD TaxID=1550240 RepID=UPI000BB72986|nr:glutamate--tRNA ligase [Thermoanaerobacterium sp. RBIITD]SNX54347.1 nondiscriminating glutamyl-tRNA synthetase [Thermoanaerobacterium sp. RBIITD]